METKTLKEWKSFYISEFRAEEAWLSFMHTQGWRLQSIDRMGFHYIFEECEPEEWIYQLDFKSDDLSDKDYLLMYEDYGWEPILRFRHWFYFRKKKSGTAAEDLSIFSDNESRIRMCRQVITHHAKLFAFILGVIFLFAGIMTILAPEIPAFRGVLAGASIGCLFSAMFVGNQFKQLNRMIKKMDRSSR